MSRTDERELLSALLDGELSPEEEARVRKLLAARPDLREELRDLEAVVDLVRDIPGETAPEGLRSSVMERLSARSRRRRTILRLAPLAAAAVLLLTAYLTWPPQRRGRTPGPPEVASASSPRADRMEERDLGTGGEKAPEEIEAAAGARREGGFVGGRAAPAGTQRPRTPPTAKQGRGGAVQTAEPGPPTPTDLPVATVWRYRLRGTSPDAAAGVLLAELGRLRSQCERRTARPAAAGKAARERFTEEKVEQDARGEPVALHLHLTTGELLYLQRILAERKGAIRLESIAGLRKPPAEDAGPERLPVVIRFLESR